jgi:hypothetical protein
LVLSIIDKTLDAIAAISLSIEGIRRVLKFPDDIPLRNVLISLVDAEMRFSRKNKKTTAAKSRIIIRVP